MRDEVMAVLRKHLPGPFKPSGPSNVLTRCPFHKEGQERKPSFSVNLDKGVFHCFTGGCPSGGAGTLRRMLKLLEVPPQTIDSELSGIQVHLDTSAKHQKLQSANTFYNKDPFRAEFALPESLTGPFHMCPQDLLDKGFEMHILKQEEIGYDISNNRIMYPIRDMYGNLAGYSGGITSRTTTYTHQKYRVYQGKRRTSSGQWSDSDYGPWFDDWFHRHFGVGSDSYKFENHNYLWGYDRVLPRVQASKGPSTVYIVEGFKARLWMLQAGFQDTVAIMGSYASDLQQMLIHRLGCTIVLCLDNDHAGKNATLKIGDKLWQPMRGKVDVLVYPESDSDTQPDSYDVETLRSLVSNKKPLVQYLQTLRTGRVTLYGQ